MGIEINGFKCPYCDTYHGPGGGPSWSKVNVPAGTAVIVALICANCQKTMGFVAVPTVPTRG
jgi:hypothetical protein